MSNHTSNHASNHTSDHTFDLFVNGTVFFDVVFTGLPSLPLLSLIHI